MDPTLEIVTLAGEKVSVVAVPPPPDPPPGGPPDPTCTTLLSPFNPKAEAIRVADPELTPVNIGCLEGILRPSGMKTLTGATVIFVASLLLKVIKTPPAGAALDNDNAKDSC